LLDTIQDWLGGVALTITTAIGGFLAWLGRGHQKHSERMVLLEHQAASVPQLLGEIRDEVKGMREEGRQRSRDMYDKLEAQQRLSSEHIDKVETRLRDEIKQKQDR